MKNKKKNSQNDLTSNDIIGAALLIFGHSSNMSNMMSYVPAYKQPSGIRVTCHLHPKPIGFKTFEEARKHDAEFHDYRKVRVL